MVGAGRFERPTPCAPARASRSGLRWPPAGLKNPHQERTFSDRLDKNFFLSLRVTFCHTEHVLIVAPLHTQRARIPIHVVLRMTAMDVCCGPPSLR